jgi:hypothetical protein
MLCATLASAIQLYLNACFVDHHHPFASLCLLPTAPYDIYRFEQHCWSAWEPRRKAWRDCFSDEHYFPTLLAVLRRENETECEGWGVAAQDWSKGGAHPRAFK